MPGYAICPYCRATVRPLAGPDGQNLCPRCRNLGDPAAAPAPHPYAPYAPYVPKPTVPGAIPSLVLGIVGIVTTFLALPCGVIAFVLAVNAQKELETNPLLGGQGMVTAARIVAIVAMAIGALTVLFFITMFTYAGEFD